MFHIKHKKSFFLANSVVVVSVCLLLSVLLGGIASAAKCANGTEIPTAALTGGRETSFCEKNGGLPDTTTATPADTPKTIKSDCPSDNNPNLSQNNCAIIKYLVLFIKALSGIVGVVIVGGIIVGGIQYSVSGDDPAAVTAAKKRILNSLIALALFIFTFAILQYLVPGGVVA